MADLSKKNVADEAEISVAAKAVKAETKAEMKTEDKADGNKTTSGGNNNFLKGTMILALSGVVVKIIGSLNWIILSRVLGGEGIGLYQMGFPIYLMAITVSSAGIPVAISIITAEKVAHRDYIGAKRVFKVTLRLLLVTALIFSVGLFFGAQKLVDWRFIRDPRAYYSIIALAPAVFFVTFLASFRGYLQGWQIMTPTAVSEITEQLVRVVTMLFFASYFLPYGLEYAAGGASMGAGAGALCALLVLVYFYRRLDKKVKKAIRTGKDFLPAVETPAEVAIENDINRYTYNPGANESAGAIIKRLLKLALPVSMTSLMLPIVANLDLLIVPQRLEAAGFSLSKSTELFGYLTGMAVPLINLSTLFTAALAVSLVPAISEARSLGKGLQAKTKTAFQVAMIVTFPCFIGLNCLAEKVAALIYNAPGAAQAIETMSIGIVFLGLHQVSTAVLQGMGKTSIPVINMGIACIVKVLLNWNLTAISYLGIRGSAMATVADFAVAALINMYFIHKLTGFKVEVKSVLKPFIAAVIMGAAVEATLILGESLGSWALLAAVAVAVPVYGIVLTVIGGVTKQELENVPFVGRRVLAIGQRFGYFR